MYRFRPSEGLRWALLLALACATGAPAAFSQQPAPQAAQPLATVEGQGLASYRPDDAARSRDEALEAAQRDAVEKASGVFISSETQMRNFELVQDEVLTRSKGFIKSYKVLSQGREGEMYKMTISAAIERAAFIKDMDHALENLYQRVGRPRVVAVIREKIARPDGSPDEQAAALQVTEKEIRKILIKQGFTFVDARALLQRSVLEMALKGEQVARDTAVDLGRTAKAEVVIVGNAATTAKAVSSFQSAQADLSLDVLRVDNGQVLASETAGGRGVNIDAQKAAVAALQDAANKITPKMMEQVSYLWVKERSEGSRIEIVVENAKFGHLMNLRKALANEISGVKQVRQRSYSNGVALLEVSSRRSAEQLAESLYGAKFTGFTVEVVNVTPSTLKLSLKESGAAGQ
ncbi:MAG: hypothetical protein HY423_13395 [Candidatus Lambdaproteobacteria bacterium]|nr:hypothetical protein [Candidatus Lambdaproteobacteria bacterium]